MSLLLVLGQAAARDEHDAASPVAVVAAQRFSVTTREGTGSLALYVSQDWDRPQPAVTRAVITIHGVLRNADVYKKTAEQALAAAGLDPATVLLIEPQFLDAADASAFQLPAETLRWSHTGWQGGEPALGPAPISSYAALDAILARLADRRLFPALETVVVSGHSGGGQVVQRYAVATQGEAALLQHGVRLRYVVANPSSYAYFSPDRPAGDGFTPFDAASCPDFDHWKYGMTARPAYLAGPSSAQLEAAYVARDVIYLLGTADTDPNHPALDKSCMAEAQGPYRYARGLAYFRYLSTRHRGALAHRVLTVPGVGHDGDRMLTSACGLAALYDRPGCSP